MLGQLLERFDVDVRSVEIGGRRYHRVLHSTETHTTVVGTVRAKRTPTLPPGGAELLQLSGEHRFVGQALDRSQIGIFDFSRRGVQPGAGARQLSPRPGVACGRSLEMNDTFEEGTGLVEKPATGIVLAIPKGVSRQPDLGLRKLEQCRGLDGVSSRLPGPIPQGRACRRPFPATGSGGKGGRAVGSCRESTAVPLRRALRTDRPVAARLDRPPPQPR